MTQEDKLFQVRKSSISYWGKSETTSNSFRKNEVVGQSRSTQLLMCLMVKLKSNATKAFNCETWNVRSMNKDKLNVVKQGRWQE